MYGYPWNSSYCDDGIDPQAAEDLENFLEGEEPGKGSYFIGDSQPLPPPSKFVFL